MTSCWRSVARTAMLLVGFFFNVRAKLNAPPHSDGAPRLPVFVFVHVGKTASSTFRRVLDSIDTAHPEAHFLCQADPEQEILAPEMLPRCDPSAEVVVGAEFGACSILRKERPCSYIVLLREPIDRLISEYNYMCRDCRDKAKFCSCAEAGCNTNISLGKEPRAQTKCKVCGHATAQLRFSPVMCPRMSFLDWARYVANQYTRHFARSWSSAGLYYNAYFSGFDGLPPVTADDVAAAAAALGAPDMHLLWTDELDGGGWKKVASLFQGSAFGVAFEQDLAQKDTEHASEGHVNAHEHTFVPTDEELEQARRILRFDLLLYEELRRSRR